MVLLTGWVRRTPGDSVALAAIRLNGVIRIIRHLFPRGESGGVVQQPVDEPAGVYSAGCQTSDDKSLKARRYGVRIAYAPGASDTTGTLGQFLPGEDVT